MKFIKLQHVAIAIPFIVCMLAPTGNSTQDGYAYAGDARWGNSIFSPHHLLYTTQLFLFAKLFAVHNTLALGKLINAFYVGSSLIVLYQILKTHLKDVKSAAAYTFFVGCSFAILRFGTENETYIVPIFFSLTGNLFFVRARANNHAGGYFAAGFFTAFACIFHQVQFFWWFVLAICTLDFRKLTVWKPFAFYCLSAFIVPVVYTLVLVFYLHQPLTVFNLLHFVFSTFFTGSSSLGISFLTVLRWLLSIARTFVQIHPTLLFLAKIHIAWLLAMLLSGVFLLFAIVITCLKNTSLSIRTKPDTYMYLAVVACNLLYSFLDKGNSEFMVMLPYLMVLLLSVTLTQSIKYLWVLSSAMLLWNITVALVPLHQYNFLTYRLWAEKIRKNTEAHYFMYDGVEIQNILYYDTGKEPANCHTLDRMAPEKIKKHIDSLLQKHQQVFTNYVSTPVLQNSASFMMDIDAKKVLKIYSVEVADSVGLFGKQEYLYRLKY